MKRPSEFYKDLEYLRSQNMKLLLTFGNKDYQEIKELPENIKAYITKYADKIKKLGFLNFKILLDNYGLYNIDDLIKNSTDEFLKELSKKPDLIKDMDILMIEKLSSLGIIALDDAPRIKVLFSDYFDSVLYKDDPRLVEKIFSGEKLFAEDFLSLLMAGLDISKIPNGLFDENIQALLKTIDFNELYKCLKDIPISKLKEFLILRFSKGNALKVLEVLTTEQLKEILNCLDAKQIYDYFNNYDLDADYKLNAWKCSERTDYNFKYTSKTAILQLMGIKSDPALMIESPFYEGHPINLSDYVEEEQYNKIVSLFFQNYITFEGFKGLYNYFNEAEIEIIIKSLEKNFAKDADTGPYFNDRNSGFDLLTMINSSEYEKIREIFVNNNKKGFNQNDLIYQEWLKVLTEEEKKDSKLLGYVNYFSMVFPFAKAREILDQFKTLQLLSERLSQINVNNGYYWRTDDVALIGAMIVFDAFNNPDNINKIFEVYQEIGITKFKILFTGITERLSPSFLEDIRNNYKAITENTGYLNEHNFEAFLKPKYESFEEMIEDYNNYKCVHNNIAPVVYKMKQKGASEEYCRYYSQLYEKAIKRPGLAIPYVSYHGEYFSFEAAKLWDSTLVGFDIENNINMPPEAKDNLLTNNNCRLIEVKDKQGLVIDQIYVQINSENKVVLSSLMEIRNTQIKMQIYNKIIEEMTKQFLQAGITATFEITQGLNELVSGSDSSTIFGEKPREITLPSGEYINDKPEYNLDFIKITSIGQIAFWGAGNHDYTNEIRNTNGESTTFYVGRDWFIKTDRNAKSQTLNKQGIPVEFKKPNTYIDFMARYSSDRSSIGQQELSDCIVDMVTNSDDTFLVGSHPTSYYTFAKLAAEGKIFVISDYKLVTEGEGLMSSMNITDVIVDNEQGYDFTAINRSFSVSFIPLLRGKGVVGNEITFISPRNLSETQKQRMAEQIKYYSGLVKYLEEARRKEKSPENNFWFHGYGSQEEIYEQLEKELPDIKNLRIYSIGYLKNILEKRSACDFATYTTSPKPYYSSTK